MRRLEGRTALVTGSSSGIGRGIAVRLHSEGANVICGDLRPEPARGGYDDTGSAVPTHELVEGRFVTLDAGDELSVEAAFNTAGNGLDVAVLNAGVFAREVSILGETAEEHDHLMRVNERGVWLGCRAAARRFVAQGSGGRIVCIASISGLVGLRDEPAYCGSKGAVVGLVRGVAADLAAHRINVNAVCPGFIATAMLHDSLADDTQRAQLEGSTPWPRLGRPEDVAAAVAFLASDDAEWITGIALPVDGGYTCV